MSLGRIAFAVAVAVAAVTACSGSAAGPATYYLALGDAAHGDDRTGNLSARCVLAVMIGARRGRVSERKLRRESFADRQRRA